MRSSQVVFSFYNALVDCIIFGSRLQLVCLNNLYGRNAYQNNSHDLCVIVTLTVTLYHLLAHVVTNYKGSTAPIRQFITISCKDIAELDCSQIVSIEIL